MSYMHRMVCLMLMCYYLINLLSIFMTVPSTEGRQPQASLFDIWAEAIRWEQEGMRMGSHSVPSAHGIQCEVQRRLPIWGLGILHRVLNWLNLKKFRNVNSIS